ncbi:hypothetical protein [Haloarcula litorea]|uniref:hypothetical protein n=1 Tax=Haloarcula litorea TaxID=3032579 RepID=UPI0023E7FDFB|nr:hypothetical protein [Halomicroarcula sp. GDY20]
MTSPITQLRDRINETLSSGSEDDTKSIREQSSLFQCRTCNTVYVAIDKTRCKDCDDAVEPVRATLSNA